MSNTYTWAIKTMPQSAIGSVTDAVVGVMGTLTGTDGKNTATVPVFVQFNPTAEDVASPLYVPYANLTEAIVIEWLKNALGEKQIASLEQNVNSRLIALANPEPTQVISPLPWAHA